ncbi:MAG: hypothetical protein LH472_13700 [Pyrinomonadaceae bacterium]|nr:hypothetical protein [Pyrinomonadaceae bacterium]
MKLLTVLILACFSLNACAGTVADSVKPAENGDVSGVKIETNAAENVPIKSIANNSETAESQTKQPKTVRDFFNLLPQKYFTLEGCEPAKDKNCDKARREYVKTFLETEDTANGYWKSGCDGGQSCLRMALFKRPDASYVVAVHTLHEADEVNYFLEYKNRKWSDISAQVVPEFSDQNIYDLPQKGTTVEVFKKVFPEPEFSERGAKIYDLTWKDGKFTIKK